MENPEEIFFSHSMSNISAYLLTRVNNKIKSSRKRKDKRKDKGKQRLTAYEKFLFNKLINLINNKRNFERRLISHLRPSALARLQNISKTIKLSSLQDADLKALKECLDAINRFYVDDKVLLKVRDKIIKKMEFKKKNTNVFSSINLILQFFLTRYPCIYVKNILKQVLSSVFFQGCEEKLIEVVIKDTSNLNFVRNFVGRLLNIVEANADKLKDKQHLNSFLKYLFQFNAKWRSESNLLITKLKQILEKHSEKINNSISKCIDSSSNIPLVNVFDDDKIIEEIHNFIVECISSISSCILIKCLDDYYSPSGVSKLLDIDGLFSKFSSLLEDMLYCKRYKNTFMDFSYSFAEASLHGFLKLVSHHIACKVDMELKTSERSQLTNFIIDLLYKKSREDDERNGYFQGRLEHILTEFDFRRKIIEHVNGLAKRLAANILDVITSIDKVTDHQAKSFLDIQMKSIGKELRSGTYFQKVPTYLDIDSMKRAIVLLMDELLSQQRLLRVYFMIGNMDCEGTIRRIDKVTFYDSRKWDFEEHYTFDLPFHPLKTLSEEFKSHFDIYETYKHRNGNQVKYQRNSARAFVDVYAKDPYTAINKAKILLNESLDALVFASGAKRDVGFRPQLPTYYQIIDRASRDMFSTAESIPHSETLQLTKNYDEIISYYDNFMKSNDNTYKNQVTKALAWFHKGRWEQILHAKFVHYWIALEQLVTKAAKDENAVLRSLLKYLPKLTSTWKKVGQFYIINGHLQEIINKIKSEQQIGLYVKKNMAIEGWEKNPYIILEGLSYLKNIPFNTSFQQLVENLEGYLTENVIQEIKNHVTHLRHIEKLKIAILYEKRNFFVHEGMTYFAQLDSFTKSLEGVLIDVLFAFLSYGKKRELKRIIFEQNRPFQVR